MKVSASVGFEVEIDISGTYQKGYPERGPSFASGGEPGEPDGFEDVSVEDISALRRSHLGSVNPAEWGWERTSLLKGIDLKSASARLVLDQLFANILEFVGEDAENALLEEISE